MDGIEAYIRNLLDDIQLSMFNKAKQYRETHKSKTDNWDEFLQ